jgi:hypothetical protein
VDSPNWQHDREDLRGSRLLESSLDLSQAQAGKQSREFQSVIVRLPAYYHWVSLEAKKRKFALCECRTYQMRSKKLLHLSQFSLSLRSFCILGHTGTTSLKLERDLLFEHDQSPPLFGIEREKRTVRTILTALRIIRRSKRLAKIDTTTPNVL